MIPPSKSLRVDVSSPPPPSLPSAEVPRSFRLPVAAWILAGSLACLPLIVAGVQLARGGLMPFQAGRAIGLCAVTLLFPLVSSWFIWRMAPRNEIARKAVFFVILALTGFSSLSLALRQYRAGTALTEAQEEQRKVQVLEREALTKGQSLDTTEINAHRALAAASLRAAAANADGIARPTLEGSAEFQRQLAALQNRYTDASSKIHLKTLLPLPLLTSPEIVAAHRAEVAEFKAANIAWKEYIAAAPEKFAQILQARKLPEAAIDQMTREYRRSTAARTPLVLKMRDADIEYADALTAYLDFAEENLGNWHYDADAKKIIFDKKGLLGPYNDLLKQINEIATREDGYLKEFAAIGAVAPMK